MYTNAHITLSYINYVQVVSYLQVDCEAGGVYKMSRLSLKFCALIMTTFESTRLKSFPTNDRDESSIEEYRDLRQYTSVA